MTEALKFDSTSFHQRWSEELARELRRNIEGEVRFDDGSRALYATDASNYRQVPIGVIVPRAPVLGFSHGMLLPSAASASAAAARA